MKRLYTLLIACMLTSSVAWSQMRYIDEVFDSVTVMSDLVYGVNLTVLTFPAITPDTLTFDLYLPEGDTCDERPLAVVLHTGTFLPRGLAAPTGNKDDYANAEVCRRLAKRGYVAASVRYRLGWNPQATTDIERRATIINAAYRSIQDMYAYLRFMNMTYVDLGNPYGIDTSRVAIFGVGTGGFVGFNAAVINSVQEIFIDKFRNPVDGVPFIDTNLVADIHGVKPGAINIPNHVGYNDNFHFAFGLDGAIGDSTWMEIGTSVPMVAVGTVSHPTTPFGIDPNTMEIDCDMPVFTGAGTGIFVVNISGSACMIEKANALGINDAINDTVFNDAISEVLRGQNFAQEHLWAINLDGFQAGPWEYWDSTFWKTVPSPFPDFDNIHEAGIATNPDMSLAKANAYIDTAMWFFSPRAYVALNLEDLNCDITSGIEVISKEDVGFRLAPNPASTELRLGTSSDYIMHRVGLYDLLGRQVHTENVESFYHTIDVSGVQPGIYIVRADFDQGFVTERVLIQR